MNALDELNWAYNRISSALEEMNEAETPLFKEAAICSVYETALGVLQIALAALDALYKA